MEQKPPTVGGDEKHVMGKAIKVELRVCAYVFKGFGIYVKA